jgi:thiol-disulfide isomerase/thioredoxin
MSGSNFSHFSDDAGSAAPAAGRGAVWPWIVLLVVVAMLVAYLVLRPTAREGAGDKHPAVGQRIVELRLEPLTGGGSPVSIDDLQGKVTLINFWGPWCPPCRREFPHLQELEQHFRDNPRFQFLSISCSGGPGSDEHMGPQTAEFLDEQRANFPTYRDPDQQFARHLMQVARLDDFVFPTSLVVDQQGTIRGLWLGYLPGDERQVQRLIEAILLAGK